MLAVVRVRGSINVKPQLKKTLEFLKLSRANQLVLVPEKQLPMLKKVEAYITWGEISNEMLEKLVKKRAMIAGNKKIDEKFLKQKGFHSWKDFLKEIAEEKIKFKTIGIKPVFRLRPPRKGFGRKGIKKPYALGGGLGYRASDINDLISRMI